MPSIPSLNTGYLTVVVAVIRRNAMFDMAFNQTTNMMKNQLNADKPEATGMWNNFKKYFKVSNRYVVAKLRVCSMCIGIIDSSCCFLSDQNRGNGSLR